MMKNRKKSLNYGLVPCKVSTSAGVAVYIPSLTKSTKRRTLWLFERILAMDNNYLIMFSSNSDLDNYTQCPQKHEF